MKGHNSFENLKTKKDVLDFFKINFNDLLKLIPDLSEQYFYNPLSLLGFSSV